MSLPVPDFLAHLPVLGGIPVPWVVNCNHPDDTYVEMDEALGGALALFHNDGLIEPLYGAMRFERQRQAMIYGLCQVCARPVDWGFRALVVSRETIETINLHTHQAYAVREPWVCGDCAAFATKFCPDLVRRRQGDDLKFVPINHPDDVQLVIEHTEVDGQQVATWCKVIILNVEPE